MLKSLILIPSTVLKYQRTDQVPVAYTCNPITWEAENRRPVQVKKKRKVSIPKITTGKQAGGMA
jgi:hypothetical protein